MEVDVKAEAEAEKDSGMQLQCNGQKQGMPFITCKIEPEDDPVTVITEDDKDAIPSLGCDDKAVLPGPSQNIMDVCFVKEETVINPGNPSGHSDVCVPVVQDINDVHNPNTITPDTDGLLIERIKTTKSGRPTKRKLGRPKTSDKSRAEQQREARKRYKQAHPEVVRQAQKRYAAKHPEVNRAAVKRYTEKHPEVNRAAAKRYAEKHREVNRAAVKRYAAKHPEVHRAAAKRYAAKHPEVNRAASKRYADKVKDKVKNEMLLFNGYGVQDLQETFWVDVPDELEITYEQNDPLQCNK
ncbi:uncharacterized protein LOC105392711 isoform X2 [Plutella xylostella]|uniref:uncharacterized protein LOC105392711 isoform X2 n=1 Tax=Plutella xylostella TaxID=51655 RepID=UPI002032A21A|nr:uncharacterized protein LOC105392711 isoform X2 [Plutella xylostella]